MARPHNLTDLYLAPVVLGIDAELEALNGKSHDDLLMYIAIATNQEPRSVSERRRYILEAVTRFQEMHGWVADWHPRGLRLSNGDHHLVLGVPLNVHTYLDLADGTAGADTTP